MYIINICLKYYCINFLGFTLNKIPDQKSYDWAVNMAGKK